MTHKYRQIIEIGKAMHTSFTVEAVIINGVLNRAATLDRAKEKLDEFERNMTNSFKDLIPTAVDQVFNKYPGERLTKPDVATFGVGEMKVPPSQYSKVKPWIITYLQDNSKGENSLFIIGKGKAGGVMRRTQATATESESLESSQMAAE